MSKKLHATTQVLINLVPIATGGGLQNALSFISQLDGLTWLNEQARVVCIEGSAVHRACREARVKHDTVRAGLLGRVYFELAQGRALLRKHDANVVFALFGGGPMVVPRGVRRVSGFAYSNLLSPSVPFWRWLPWYRRLGRFAKDAVRRWQTSRLDLILCETEYWADRARGAFPGSRVAVVEMAPGQLILDALAGLETQERVASESPGDVEKGAYRLLYLSGPHPNKRIHELASVLRRADELVDNSIRLVLTLPPSDSYTLKVLEAFSAQDSLHLVENVGPIGPREVARELRDANLVLNTAALESFSNNWVEAWASATPLVTTDAAWTRDACGNAAVFIDLDRPADAAGAIAEVLVAAELRSILIANGRQRLERLPSPAERAKRFEAFVREVSNES